MAFALIVEVEVEVLVEPEPTTIVPLDTKESPEINDNGPDAADDDIPRSDERTSSATADADDASRFDEVTSSADDALT